MNPDKPRVAVSDLSHPTRHIRTSPLQVPPLAGRADWVASITENIHATRTKAHPEEDISSTLVVFQIQRRLEARLVSKQTAARRSRNSRADIIILKEHDFICRNVPSKRHFTLIEVAHQYTGHNRRHFGSCVLDFGFVIRLLPKQFCAVSDFGLSGQKMPIVKQ